MTFWDLPEFKKLKSKSSCTPSYKPKFTFIDLFAGCGGLSLGLERAGFTPLLVNELNTDALETYLLNRREEFPWLYDNNVANVKDLVLNETLLLNFGASIKKDFRIDIFNGELDLICGGPPCQGFSGLGIRRSYSVEKKQLPSNFLYQDMAFLVNRIRPKIFLFENVRGLLSARWTNDGTKGEIFQDVLKTFENIGAYHIRYKLVHAKDYGVPQNRPRVLIVGLRKDLFNEPKTHFDAVADGFLPRPIGGYPSIEELLSDLIDPNYQRGATTEVYPTPPQNEVQQRFRTKRDGSVFGVGEALSEMEYSNHSDMIVAKFTAMINNGGIIPEEFKTKKFAQKVLPRNWGKAGPTITACSAPDDYVHFSQPRSLTVREWARLQTFPDWYIFAGKRTTGGLRRAGNPREGIFDRELPKYTQIGNAVPVELAYNIGNHFIQLLKRQKKASC
ncbi:MAG: DNA cytosine methyltransferase [Kiritimatiellae bacterium]|nr:DNA cytosine methyltransferase [Kiritimatiellia bacterium]